MITAQDILWLCSSLSISPADLIVNIFIHAVGCYCIIILVHLIIDAIKDDIAARRRKCASIL